MMKKISGFIITLVGLYAITSTGFAGAVYSEDFSDLTSPRTEGWFENRFNLAVSNESLSVPSIETNQFGTYFPATTIAVGESIELRFTASFTLLDPLTSAWGTFRVGLFNSDGRAQPTGGGSNGQPSGDATGGYQGIGAWFSPLYDGNSNAIIGQRNPGATGLLTISDRWQLENRDSAVANESMSYAANTVYDVVLSFSRNTDTAGEVFFSFGDHERSLASTAFSQAPTFTFDTLGMYLEGTSGDATLDNFSIVVIPEPSTYGLLGGFLAVGALIFRRRSWRQKM